MNTEFIYELRRPANFESDKKYPVIFLMHGMGSNEQNMLPLTAGMDKEVFVISVRGQLEQPPGYALSKYPIDKQEVYLMGISQGAILSMTLGLKLGNRIKGIIALSGYIPALVKDEYEIRSLNGVQAFISHGEYDQVLPYEWGFEAESFLKQYGAVSTFGSFPEGHTVSQQNHNDYVNWLVVSH